MEVMKNSKRTQIVSFHIPNALLDALDQLVQIGVFNNRSEAIRTALSRLVLEYASAFKDRRRGMMISFG